MGDLSPHFSRHEFACKGCGKGVDGCVGGFDTVDSELLIVLETVRDRYGRVTITSGCRCKAWNKAVGGTRNSQHQFARAADIVVDGVPAWEIQEFIDNTWPDRYGLGKYEDFTHIDTRRNRARWSG
jgi:uncharacterized protein YcbK (DUF882 family)